MNLIKRAIIFSTIPTAVILIVILLAAFYTKGDYTETDMQLPSQHIHLIVSGFPNFHEWSPSINNEANDNTKAWIIIEHIPSSPFHQETQTSKA
jgi:hypothetical protein